VLNKQILLVFGETTIEPWQDIGAANMPLERVPGVVIERGLRLRGRRQGRQFGLFPRGGPQVLPAGWRHADRDQHARPRRGMAEYSVVSDTFCFSYSWAGAQVRRVAVRHANKTFVFDISTGSGMSGSRGTSTAALLGAGGQLRCQLLRQGSDRRCLLRQDRLSERDDLYRIRQRTTQALCTSPPIHADRKRVFISRLELDIEAGVGITTGQGSDPQWMLRSPRTAGEPIRTCRSGGRPARSANTEPGCAG
jgi:hypothetical protein